VAKLEAAIANVQGERDAEKENVRALEGNMKEAGDLGKKLEEKEAEFRKIKEEMGVMQKDLEAQLSSATKEWKASSEALTRELCVTEERDKIKARLQSIETTALKQATMSAPVANVDPSALPRIIAGTTLAMPKVEAKTRGHKGFSSLGKDGLLRMVGGVGSIYLSQTSESKRYHEVLRLMESEESAQNAQRCTAEREVERQRQAERARQVAEEDQREMKRVAALHTHKSAIHACPLAPTMHLQSSESQRQRRMVT